MATGFVFISPSNAWQFANASSNDLLFYTSSNNQKMLFGVNATSNANITLSSNLTEFSGDLAIKNGIAIKGLRIMMSDGTTANISSVTSMPGFSNDNLGVVISMSSNTSNNYFRYQAGANEIARITGHGCVGIGNSNPSSLLHITSNTSNYVLHTNSSNQTGIRVGIEDTADSAGGWNGILWNMSNAGLRFGTNNTERIRISSNGFIGIGTSVPLSRLHLNNPIASSSNNIIFEVGATADNSVIGWSAINFNGYYSGGEQIVNTNKTRWRLASVQYQTNDYFTIDCKSQGSNTIPAVNILNSGYVGIGTTTPAYTLDVNGTTRSSNYVINSTANAAPAVGTNGGTGDKLVLFPGTPSTYPYSLGISPSTLWYSVPATTQHQWYIGGTAGMTFSNGRLGIGTSSPEATLDVMDGSIRTRILTVTQNPSSTPTYNFFIVSQGAGVEGIGGGYSLSDSLVKIGRSLITNGGRSINAAGTLNASGSDYAEYMLKQNETDVFSKGDVVGISADGLLTDDYDRAITFVVKSTDPSFVGGDTWGNNLVRPSELDSNATEEQKKEYDAKYAEFSQELEAIRVKYDRIAFSGQVPVNVIGSIPGDYIIPVRRSDGKISAKSLSPSVVTLQQYMQSVGKVIAILPDGRAKIIVKVV